MEELLKYAGNPAQLGGVREVECVEGRSRGMRLYEVRTPSLSFDLLPDKCLDIANLSYKGVNINWLAKNGFSADRYAHPVLNEFDRYFSGGMLMTCGLKNTGPDHVDENGFFQLLHGRIGVTPCEQSWHQSGFEDGVYTIRAGGTTRDSILGGHNLCLERTVATDISQSEISIKDVLRNSEPVATDYLILYHFNFGYPFIDSGLRLQVHEAKGVPLPRSEAARQGLSHWQAMGEPMDGYEEQCFFHHQEPDTGGYCHVSLENVNLKIGVCLSYEAKNLPILTQWKSLRSGEYVLGIEPGNSYISGMDSERKAGRVGRVAAFGEAEFRLSLKFYELP